MGTTARIEECREVEGGRFVLNARGVHRFRLLRMLPARPYPYGEVEYLPDQDEPITPNLSLAVETVRTTFPLYFRMALSLTDQWAQGLRLPDRPHELVDFLAFVADSEGDVPRPSAGWIRFYDELAQQHIHCRRPTAVATVIVVIIIPTGHSQHGQDDRKCAHE